ncbi:NAD binding domain of 6-phosphogluconate dehydrogenase-domain-containing protein [Schizophyllum amplum]|uniref:NAD binding domain of 6-phosphogluconate dehydrogenase-domain-containing protein n=1 Tax=Schizophyllum amplum TaxID=97359 RepID=A0A550CM38_9AGAR|nr:NAD binding domain of 6-phosphogluconate dehydrogenase-domain-containing protein [Auriculariopsis ampla]
MNRLNVTKEEIPFSRPASPGRNLTLGWVGLGNMGYLMARNLAKGKGTGPPLLVWNRTTSKAEGLQKEVGSAVSVAKDLTDIVEKCDVIFTSLNEDSIVKSIYEQFAETLKSKPASSMKIFVETSTIFPSLAIQLDDLITVLPHCHFVTSPVFGAPAAADKAQLLIVMSGDYKAKKEAAHLLVPSVGRKVLDLGGNIAKAPTFKLIGNSMILGTVEILAEGFTFADKSGIDPSIMINYANRMAHDNFDGSTGFSIEGGIKDASHIRHLSTKNDVPLPAIDVAYQHLLTARALHRTAQQAGTTNLDVLDWSGMVAGARVAAGLDAFDSTKHKYPVQESND